MNKVFVLLYTLFVFFGLIPAFASVIAMKRSKLTPPRILRYSILLMVIGTIFITFSTDLLQVVQKYLQPDNPDYNLALKFALHISVWGYVFPAISIGLGVNLLTEYLVSESKTKSAAITRRPTGRAKATRR